MSRLYATQPAIYGKARAWLAKCYIEQNLTYDAEDVIRNMERDSIHWRARRNGTTPMPTIISTRARQPEHPLSPQGDKP